MIPAILITIYQSLLALSISLQVSYDSEAGVLFIEGAKAGMEVAVFFGEFRDANQTQVLGKFGFDERGASFRPKYGVTRGGLYTVVIGPLNNPDLHTKGQVIIPESVTVPSTHVVEVYPSGSKLPMNQLKLYIEFSGPMRMGSAYDHIRLYRLPDRKLESEAFLAMPEELWDPERKRLTVFFDPGRIKRGVQPNLQLGLPLVEGRKYELVIDKEWLDINGAALKEEFRKEFEVVSVDRQSPNPDNWDFKVPMPNSKRPLSIDFGESMDYGLLSSTMAVVNTRGELIEGEINISNSESQWQFRPAAPWQQGEYQLVIDTWLEDLAGNNLKRKFDVDLLAEEDKPKDIREVIIPFEISTQNH